MEYRKLAVHHLDKSNFGDLLKHKAKYVSNFARGASPKTPGPLPENDMAWALDLVINCSAMQSICEML